MEWFEIENPSSKRIPAWLRSAGLSKDGVVFVPGALVGNEQEALLCAAYDCTPTVQYLNHAYFPAKWMAAEFPKTREICEKIEATIKKACADRDMAESPRT